jgi:hypothetical protein
VRCQTRIQRSVLLASLADLNSYNKPFRIPQALRQIFFSLVFKEALKTLSNYSAFALSTWSLYRIRVDLVKAAPNGHSAAA